MDRPIGHESVLDLLEAHNPQVIILEGEESVGKWTTAMWLKDRVADRMKLGDYLEAKHLDIKVARQIRNHLIHRPYGILRLAVVYLAPYSTVGQMALLKTLEELPGSARVIFVAPTGAVLPTLASRGSTFYFLPLSKANVEEILLARNFNPSMAEQLARLSGGHVGNALRYASANGLKVLVLGAMRSLMTRDAKALDTFASRWSDDHTDLLIRLCQETLSRRFVIFTEDDGDALGKRTALQILRRIHTDVRPQLVIHAQLMSVLRGE